MSAGGGSVGETWLIASKYHLRAGLGPEVNGLAPAIPEHTRYIVGLEDEAEVFADRALAEQALQAFNPLDRLGPEDFEIIASSTVERRIELSWLPRSQRS